MYHSILVGQDASDYSASACALAVWLATATRARLHLIHLHSRKPHIHPTTAPDEMRDVMRQRLAAHRDIQGDCRVVEGWTAQALVGEAKWHDLVVVGRHGESAAARRDGIGSLPTTLLAASPVPVLIAAERAAVPDQLVVAFDNSVDACMALRISAALAAERHLKLHVVEPAARRGSDDHLAHARAYLDDWHEVDADFETLNGKASDAVVAYITKHGIPLAFVPALDRSLFGRKLTTRITRETAASLIVPRGQSQRIY